MKSLLPTVSTQKDVEQKKQQFNLKVPKNRFIANYIGTGEKVLDVGCFTGYCSKAFQEMGNTVVGIDASPPAIKKAMGTETAVNHKSHERLGAPCLRRNPAGSWLCLRTLMIRNFLAAEQSQAGRVRGELLPTVC